MDRCRRFIGQKGPLVVGALVVMVSALACGDDTPGAAEATEPPAAAEGWTDDDIEYKLAVVDAGGFVATNDPVIDRYAAALDNAQAVCPESRTMLADVAVRSVQLLDENVPGHSETALSMLQAISQAASAGKGLGVECTEIAATIIVIIQGSQ